MSHDVLTQLRSYAGQLDARAPSLAELMPPMAAPAPPERPAPRRRWVAAVVAAVIVLALIGVVAGGMLVWGEEEPPVITDPTTTTLTTPNTLTFPPPDASGAGARWTRVPHENAVFGAESAQIYDVAFGASGYVAIGVADSATTVWTSADGAIWVQQPANSEVFGDASWVHLLTAAGPGFVAIGHESSGAAVWTSADGTSWARAPVDSSTFANASISGLASGSGHIVAGGSQDGEAAIWHSGDGYTWEPATVADGSGGSIVDISVGGPGFVAVGSGSGGSPAVWTSGDGLTWARVSTGEVFSNTSIWALASTSTSTIAVGQDNSFNEDGHPALWASPEGVAWTRVDLDPDLFERSEIWDVIADGSAYVAVGSRNSRAAMWTSEDGLTWELAELDPTQNDRAAASSVAAGAGRLIAVGSQALSPEVAVGAVWVSQSTSPEPPAPTSTTTSTTVLVSDGDLVWHRIDLDSAEVPDGRLYDVASGESGLAALGLRRESDGSKSRLVMTSTDGLLWDVAAVLDQQPLLTSIVAGGPGWVAGGYLEREDGWYDPVFAHSEDGTDWTNVQLDSEDFEDSQVNEVVAGGPGFVAIGEFYLDTPTEFTYGTALWTSPDGVTWNREAQPEGLDEAYWLEPTDTGLVAIGWESVEDASFITAFTSVDGVNWTQTLRESTGAAFVDYTEAGHRGSEVIRVHGARGTNSMTVWLSTDGSTWTQHEAEIEGVEWMRDVAGIGSWWVATGLTADDVPAVWVSQDGVQWARVPDDGSVFGSGGGIVEFVEHEASLVAVGWITDEIGEHPTAWVASPAG